MEMKIKSESEALREIKDPKEKSIENKDLLIPTGQETDLLNNMVVIEERTRFPNK